MKQEINPAAKLAEAEKVINKAITTPDAQTWPDIRQKLFAVITNVKAAKQQVTWIQQENARLNERVETWEARYKKMFEKEEEK